jgi:16S rRNA (cytidine1402-2'-O)-methyltransferase
MTAGRLVLVATPIGNLADLTPRAVETFRSSDEIWCEDTRRTATLLRHAGISGAGRLRAVHAHNEAEAASRVVGAIRAGRTIAYASDAGMPGISDPGERLVAACAAAGLAVEVVPGPSAVLGALVVSGLPTGRFAFEGFLPRKGPERRARLDEIACRATTTVIFEAPPRVAATIADLADACGADRPAAIARELTKRFEQTVRGTLGALRSTEVRGECAIVVGPAPPRPAPVDADVDGALRSELAAGSSARDAAATVADLLGVPRRRAYERAVAIKRSG